jgi:predicted transposase YbfD/YdcC
LLGYLATVPDPRAPRGRRHPLIAILAMAAAAVLGGARSMTAIAEWAADAPQPVRVALGARRDSPDRCSVPSETTIRRTLGRLDADALAAAIGAWLANRDDQTRHRRAIAVDGKTLRGASDAHGRQVHLLAAMDHTTRAVLAQRQVDGAPGEVPAFQPLLSDLDLAGVVVTADALQTHREAAEFLVTRKQAHYLFVVKANQPTLLDRCASLPWHRVPVADRTRDRGHGRVELRTVKAVTVNHFGFPHAAQVIQVTRKTRDLGTRRWHTVVVYAITSLSFAQACPARLAHLLRGHWTIENGLHCVRGVTFAEDASQLRTGTARRSWSACATWSSACSAGLARSTSPPRCATTAATPTDHWSPWGSALEKPTSPRSPKRGRSGGARRCWSRGCSALPRVKRFQKGRPGADDDRCGKLLGAGDPCHQPVADEGLRGLRRLMLAALDQQMAAWRQPS